MHLLSLIFIFILLSGSELVYFKLADHFNIIDKPNARSSHTVITVRGGGIIFSIASTIFFCFYGFQYPYFISGLILISFISFLDDIHTLNNKVRLSIHLVSVLLIFYEWDLIVYPWYWLIIAGIFVIGTINAYNFMDGINGITGSYSLLAILTLYYINEKTISFTAPELLIIVGLALLVFNFFNFRIKAKCFAGDVGSVSMAFIIVFLIGQLIIKSGNLVYVSLLLVYGLDAIFTIFFRVIRKENIFEAHRSHFYQYLANQLKWNHLTVSALYFFVQLVINVLVIFFVKESVQLMLILILILSVLFLMVRLLVEGKDRLFLKEQK